MQTTGILSPIPPYDIALTLDLIARFPHPTVDLALDGAYWRVIRLDDELALLRVTALDNGDLQVDCAASTGTVDHDAALAKIAHILCVDLDLRPFYDFAREQPELWAVVGPVAGLHWLRTETVYEALMTTVIEQQIAWKTAQRAQRWLVEWGGDGLAYNGRTFYAFPTPEQIAAATVEDLTPLKITFRRMGVMIDLSQRALNGSLDLEGILSLPAEDAYDLLVGLKGIGHWTAAWTIQRAHGLNRFVGHNDVALQAAVNHYFYGGNGRIPGAQVQATFEPYGAFAGMAAHHTILRWVIDRY